MHDIGGGLQGRLVSGLRLIQFHHRGREIGAGFKRDRLGHTQEAVGVLRLAGLDARLDATVVGQGADEQILVRGQAGARRGDGRGGAAQERGTEVN